MTKNIIYLTSLIFLGVIIFIISLMYGAVDISINEILSATNKSVRSSTELKLNERIFIDIRLPRAILCLVVGGCLALGGTLLQALFRNPIIEPGLIGTSSGAAFGAALCFVLGASFKWDIGEWLLPIFACLGALGATFLVLLLSKSSGTGSIQRMLLTGIAVNALFLSGVGFLSFIARDPQARSITFWNLGTLAGANWIAVICVSIVLVIGFTVSFYKAKGLNALMLGEIEASNLGFNIKKLKLTILIVNVILVAVSTAYVGVIAFIGLIVPHLLRLIFGSDNQKLIVYSILLGGIVLSLADLFSRLLLKPTELPIGIVSSIIGVPIFIILLRNSKFYL